MTEPKHPGQKPAFRLVKPSELKPAYTSKGTEQAFTGWKIPISEGATHISIDDEDRGEFFLSFFIEDNSDNLNYETELAAFYSELDNHRKELAQWGEGMAKWNIYQKEMQIDRLRKEIEELLKKDLTGEREGV